MKAEGVEGVRELEDRAQRAGEGKWEMINTNEWKIQTSSLPWALIFKTNSSIQDTNKNLKRTTFFFLTCSVLEPDFQGRNMGRFRESLHRRLHLSQDLQEVQRVTMLGFDGTALWGSKAKARDRGAGREMCPCAPGIPSPLAAQHRSAEEALGTLSTANRWVSDVRSADPWALHSSIVRVTYNRKGHYLTETPSHPALDHCFPL